MRFAIIGSNFISDKFIEAGSLVEGFELAAVYSRTETRAQEFAAKHTCTTTFTDLTTLAKSDVFDAVYIASPTSEHAKQAVLMLQHGKHVLCEKPACSNLAELETILDAAAKSGCAFLEA
eukprot:gene13755-28920_t